MSTQLLYGSLPQKDVSAVQLGPTVLAEQGFSAPQWTTGLVRTATPEDGPVMQHDWKVLGWALRLQALLLKGGSAAPWGKVGDLWAGLGINSSMGDAQRASFPRDLSSFQKIFNGREEDIPFYVALSPPANLRVTSVVGGLGVSRQWYYKVTALDTHGETVGSTELAVGAKTNATVNLAWDAVGGAVSYNVYRANVSGGESSSPALIGNTAALVFADNLANAPSAGAVPSINTASGLASQQARLIGATNMLPNPVTFSSRTQLEIALVLTPSLTANSLMIVVTQADYTIICDDGG